MCAIPQRSRRTSTGSLRPARKYSPSILARSCLARASRASDVSSLARDWAGRDSGRSRNPANKQIDRMKNSPDVSERLFLDWQVALEPAHHLKFHLRKVFVPGVLVEHAAEVLLLAVEAVDGAELLLQHHDTVRRRAPVLVAREHQHRPWGSQRVDRFRVE